MSTSPKPALERESPKLQEAVPAFMPFPYDSPPSVPGSQGKCATDTSAFDAGEREALALQQGRCEGEAQAWQVFEERLARERESLAVAVGAFTRDRAAYFQQVEGEVVQLGLAVARKILHREAQIDPMLLAGMVRVALEKIDGATQVELHVHPSHAAEWKQYLSSRLDAGNVPTIIEDPAQVPDQCLLQTSMGTTILGVNVQLKEIEQGLMDLLAARPGAGR